MLEDLILTGEWTDLYTALGKVVGTKLRLQNKTGGLLYIWTGAAVPATTTSGYVLQSLGTFDVPSGAAGCFVKGSGYLFAQELT